MLKNRFFFIIVLIFFSAGFVSANTVTEPLSKVWSTGGNDKSNGVQWSTDDRFVVDETPGGDEKGTVTDTLTGLVWLQNADCLGQGKWNKALSTIDELNQFRQCRLN